MRTHVVMRNDLFGRKPSEDIFCCLRGVFVLARKGLCVAALGMLCGVIVSVIRLSYGPVELTSWRTFMLGRLNALFPNVTYKKLELCWASFSSPIEFRFSEFAIPGVLKAPSVHVSVSPKTEWPLLSISSLAIKNPHITITLMGPSPSLQTLQMWIKEQLPRFLNIENGKIENAEIEISREKFHNKWKNISIEFNNNKNEGKARFSSTTPEKPGNAYVRDVIATYKLLEAKNDLFYDIRARSIAIPRRLIPLARVDFPARIHMQGTLSLTGKFWNGTMKVTQTPGQLFAIDDANGNSLSLQRAEIDISGKDNAFDVRSASAQIEGTGTAIFSVNAVKNAQGQWNGKCFGRLSGAIPMRLLSPLWPKTSGVKARDWLTKNFQGGAISAASFRAKVDGIFLPKMAFRDVSGELEVKDVPLLFLDGLPLMKHMHAKATYSEKGFDIRILSGAFEQHPITGRVVIFDLDKSQPRLTVSVSGTGPLKTLLMTLNRPVLNYLAGTPINLKTVKGTDKTNVTLSFPLIQHLPPSLIFIDAISSEIKDAAFSVSPKKGTKLSISRGTLQVLVSDKKLRLHGTSMLSGVLCRWIWDQTFSNRAASKLSLKARASPAQMDCIFGTSLAPFLKGTVSFEAEYFPSRPAPAATIRADLGDAEASVPILQLKKIPRAACSAKVDVSFSKALDLTGAHFNVSGSIAGSGRIHFGKDMAILGADCSLSSPSPLKLHYIDSPRDGLSLSFSGRVLDLRSFFSAPSPPPKSQPTYHKAGPAPFKISVACGRVILSDTEFQGVRGNLVGHKINASAPLELSNVLWKSGDLIGHMKKSEKTANSAKTPKQSLIRLHILPAVSRKVTEMTFVADNAGSFLSGVGLFSGVKGGNLVLRAEQTEKGLYRGSLKIKDVGAKMPLLARVVSLASPPFGFFNLFTKHVPFHTVAVKFLYKNNRFFIDNAVAKGINLGLTARGFIDFDKKTCLMRGTVIPAYMLSTILGYIPIIGKLLAGDEGIISTSFVIKGSLNDPKISANPISMFAPGIFKKLFQSIEDTVTQDIEKGNPESEK